MRRALLLLATVAAPFALRAQASAVPFPVKLDNAGFADALARVGDNLLIAGQPTEAALRKLAAEGVTTVISVRTPPEHANRQAVPFDEPALAQSLGMTWINVPARGDSLFPYSPASVDALAKALDGATGKVLLHCTIGYRASHLYTAYLVKYRGLSLEEATKHGRAINFGQMPLEGFLGAPLTIGSPRSP
jgi:uncharacterized protein (TIGR01244 family)